MKHPVKNSLKRAAKSRKKKVKKKAVKYTRRRVVLFPVYRQIEGNIITWKESNGFWLVRIKTPLFLLSCVDEFRTESDAVRWAKDIGNQLAIAHVGYS